jgi:predicted thioesterase
MVADACWVTYRTGVAPHTGLSARIELTVTEADTAEAFRSGSVPVLATPRLMALCEEASCKAVEGHLPESSTSVAKRLQFDHLVPVGVGGVVWAEATLDRIEGRRLVFTLSVSESAGLVAAGKLIRVIVDREAFLANVR